MSTDELDHHPSREPSSEELDESLRAARAGLTGAEEQDPYGAADPFAEWESEDAGVAELIRAKSRPSGPAVEPNRRSGPPSSPSGTSPLIIPPSLMRSAPPGRSPLLSGSTRPEELEPPQDAKSPNAPDVADVDEPIGMSEPPVARRPESLIPMRIIQLGSQSPEGTASASVGAEQKRDERDGQPQGGAEPPDVDPSHTWPVSSPEPRSADTTGGSQTPVRPPPRPSLPPKARTPQFVSRETPQADLLGRPSLQRDEPTTPWPLSEADTAALADRRADTAEAESLGTLSLPPKARPPPAQRGEHVLPRPSPPPPRSLPRPSSPSEVTTSWSEDDDDFDFDEFAGDPNDLGIEDVAAVAPSPETNRASPIARGRAPAGAKLEAQPGRARAAGEDAQQRRTPVSAAGDSGPASADADTSPLEPRATEETTSELRRVRPPVPPRARLSMATGRLEVPPAEPSPADQPATESIPQARARMPEEAEEPRRSRPPVPPRARRRLSPTSEPAAEARARDESGTSGQKAGDTLAVPVGSIPEGREAKPPPRVSAPVPPPTLTGPRMTGAGEPVLPSTSGVVPPRKAPEIAYEELVPESDRSPAEDGSPKSIRRPPPPKRAVRRPEPPPPERPVPETPRAESPEAAPSLTAKSDGQKRLRRPWWEDVFSEDFVRAERRLTQSETARECDFIVESLGLHPGGVVLDVACGSGAHAVELASRGFSVVGFDLSLHQLALAGEYAQERKQKINFLQGDVREMGFESVFDAVLCWNTSFGYFEEDKNALVAERMFHALRPEGTLLLDVANRDFVSARQPSQNWFNGDACVCMDDSNVDYITSRLRVKRSVILDDGRTRECSYSIRLFSLHELGKLLHDVGFRICEVSGHPATRGAFFGETSPRLIMLAQRP